MYEYEYTDVGPLKGGRHIVRSGGKWGTMHFIGYYNAGGTMKLYPADASADKYAGVTVVRCEVIQIWRSSDRHKSVPTDAEAERAKAERLARREAMRRAAAEQIKMEIRI